MADKTTTSKGKAPETFQWEMDVAFSEMSAEAFKATTDEWDFRYDVSTLSEGWYIRADEYFTL